VIYIPSIWYNYKNNPVGTPNILKGSVLGATKGDLSFGYNGVVDFIVCLFLILFALVSKKVGGGRWIRTCVKPDDLILRSARGLMKIH
jgi:hypothetical protein